MDAEKLETVANKTVRNPVFFALIGVMVLLIAVMVYLVGFAAKADDVKKIGRSNNSILQTMNECLQKGNCGKASKEQGIQFTQIMIGANFCSAALTDELTSDSVSSEQKLQDYGTCIGTIVPKVVIPK